MARRKRPEVAKPTTPHQHRRNLLGAIREVGHFTPTDVFRWAMHHGGSKAAYAALAKLVEDGKLRHVPRAHAHDGAERWEVA